MQMPIHISFMIRSPDSRVFIKQKDFYFKVDPYTYEDIDHFNVEDMNLSGEFVGGNILKPTRQYLIILENNSFGFNMIIPERGNRSLRWQSPII